MKRMMFLVVRSLLHKLILASGLFFILLSLLSYHASDVSPFLVSSGSAPVLNWGGSVGAWCAALLYFMWGYAVWLFVVWLAYLCWRSLYYATLHDAWDTACAWNILLMSSSMAWASTQSSSSLQVHAGGIVGYYAWSLLSTLCADRVVCSVIIGVLLISSGVLVVLRCVPLAYLSLACWYLQQSLLVGYRSLKRVMYAVRRSLFIRRVYAYITSDALLDEVEGSFYDTLDQSFHDLWKKQVYLEDVAVHAAHVIAPEKNQHQESREEQEEELPAPSHTMQPYRVPPLTLFGSVVRSAPSCAEQESYNQQCVRMLEEKLERFGIRGHVVSIQVGPVVTVFEYAPDIDAKISRIIALEDDLALALQTVSIRIIAPVPGKSVIGFEIANKQRRSVLLNTLVHNELFFSSQFHIPLILGEDTTGSPVIVDLATMPHLLVAGSTGTGKSVALNTMLISLLCKHTPEQLRLILIDPKRLEFSGYADVPHLLVPIVTQTSTVAPILRWVVSTMQDRYQSMERYNVRNIFDYQLLAATNPEMEPMPYIVIIIDELADLMMTAAKEVETSIARIAQMARAAGIHLIVATQRPSVDVITGLIKVNFPTRISFRVTSKIDSRTILDCTGAEKLLAKGDMLVLGISGSVTRVHGAYLAPEYIKSIITYVKQQRAPQYIDVHAIVSDKEVALHDHDDHLYHEVLQFVQSVDEVSISLLQRKFRIGYNRSARIIDKLESEGIIMQDTSGKVRKVIRSS